MTAAVILAAGEARRFGGQKLVAPFDGEPLIRAVARNVTSSSVERTVVVVGHDADAVTGAVADLAVSVVRNPEPDRGMGSSIRVGVEAVRAEASAVLVVLGDQPGVGPELVDRILEADPEEEAAIVVPVYRDGPANPVLFRAAVFGELLTLEGDRGARAVVEREPARTLRVEVDRPIPRDVDTPGDLARLEDERPTGAAEAG